MIAPATATRTSARWGAVLPQALVDAAMPPIISGPSRGCKIWIDDALGGAARCRRVALRQRRVAAFVIIGPAIYMQANRISRIVRLGPSGRRRQNRRDRQNRQSRNAHRSLLREVRGAAQRSRIRVCSSGASHNYARRAVRFPARSPVTITDTLPEIGCQFLELLAGRRLVEGVRHLPGIRPVRMQGPSAARKEGVCGGLFWI
jgi:hypothetical protein